MGMANLRQRFRAGFQAGDRPIAIDRDGQLPALPGDEITHGRLGLVTVDVEVAQLDLPRPGEVLQRDLVLEVGPQAADEDLDLGLFAGLDRQVDRVALTPGVPAVRTSPISASAIRISRASRYLPSGHLR